jgi:hypothetical protein
MIFGGILTAARIRAGDRPGAPGLVPFVLGNAVLPSLVVAVFAVELRKLLRWRGKRAATVVVGIIGGALAISPRWIATPGDGASGLLDLAQVHWSRGVVALPALVTWAMGHIVAIAAAVPSKLAGVYPEHAIVKTLVVFVTASLNASVVARALFRPRPVAREEVSA